MIERGADNHNAGKKRSCDHLDKSILGTEQQGTKGAVSREVFEEQDKRGKQKLFNQKAKPGKPKDPTAKLAEQRIRID